MAYVRVEPRDLGIWTWCSRCERVYHTERWKRNYWFCPGEGCGADMTHACDFENNYFLKAAAYHDAGLEELLTSPAEGAFYPWWLSPENVAHAGQHGRWARWQAEGGFVVETPPLPLSPDNVIPGPGYVEPRYQWACVDARAARQVRAVLGVGYEIRPLNPKRKRHQGRHCVVKAYGWDGKTQMWQALVVFRDDGSDDYVDIHDLWADGFSWNLSS